MAINQTALPIAGLGVGVQTADYSPDTANKVITRANSTVRGPVLHHSVLGRQPIQPPIQNSAQQQIAADRYNLDSRQLSGRLPIGRQESRQGGMEQFERIIKRLNAELNRTERRVDQKISVLPAEARSLLQLQIEINRLTVDTQLAVKAGETVTAAVRQLQQLANS